MSRILAIQNSCFWNKGGHARPKPSKLSLVRCFSLGKSKLKMEAETHSGLSIVGMLIAGSLAIAGALYLYQVNSLATKGYDMRDIENRIQNSEKEINSLKIKEVELKSMYNIEKATKDLNLITSPAVSYLNLDGPMAMK